MKNDNIPMVPNRKASLPKVFRHAAARYGGFLPEYEMDLFDHLIDKMMNTSVRSLYRNEH
jgi:hypothetical protein